MGLEPQPGAEGQAEPPPEKLVLEVVIDYAGNWTIRPVPPLTPRPAPWTEPPSAQPWEDGPEQRQRPPTPDDPPPGPMLDPRGDVRAAMAAAKAAGADGYWAAPARSPRAGEQSTTGVTHKTAAEMIWP